MIRNALRKPEKMEHLYTLIRALPIICSLTVVFTHTEHIAIFASGGEASIGLRLATHNTTLPTAKSYYVFNSTPGTTIHNQLVVTNTGAATGTGTIALY